MSQLYLPVVKAAVNITNLIAIGVLGGAFSGIFGVGSGFFVIPTMIFMGIPAKYAISASNSQGITSSFTSTLNYWRENKVDFQLGTIVLIGNAFGTLLGSKLFMKMTQTGVIDIAISLCYIFVLGVLGLGMFIESVRSIAYKRKGLMPSNKSSGMIALLQKMPFQIYLLKSNKEISAIALILLGFISGLLLALAGISLGFSVMPAMIYLMHLPTSLVIGTNFYNNTIVCSFLTLLYAQACSIDLFLVLPIMIGSSIGSILGNKINTRVPPETLRVMLSIIMLLFALKFIIKITVKPTHIHTLVET